MDTLSKVAQEIAARNRELAVADEFLEPHIEVTHLIRPLRTSGSHWGLGAAGE